jgi:hypothetical protein
MLKKMALVALVIITMLVPCLANSALAEGPAGSVVIVCRNYQKHGL